MLITRYTGMELIQDGLVEIDSRFLRGRQNVDVAIKGGSCVYEALDWVSVPRVRLIVFTVPVFG